MPKLEAFELEYEESRSRDYQKVTVKAAVRGSLLPGETLKEVRPQIMTTLRVYVRGEAKTQLAAICAEERALRGE